MALTIDYKDVNKFILVGDRVLIKPKTADSQTQSGLYLPPTVKEKEKLYQGYILKTGPGYPIPSMSEEDEPWKNEKDNTKYIPLQAEEGDLAVYLQGNAYEIEFNKEKYVIVPHNSILMLVRDEELFK